MTKYRAIARRHHGRNEGIDQLAALRSKLTWHMICIVYVSPYVSLTVQYIESDNLPTQ